MSCSVIVDGDQIVVKMSAASQIEMSQEEDLESSERKTLVTEVVMYLLAQESSKVPAKKISIVKTILQHHSKSFRIIMLQAKEVLSQIFGYHLLESDGRFFMVNKYEPSELGLKILQEPKEHKLRCSLLLLVLSLIFMEGGAAKDEEVWDFLKKLKIRIDTPDPVFGDVKKILLKDCVHMLYLQHTRRERSDPPIYEFSSGPRADAEISKRKLLEFVCKVYGNSEHDWPVQRKELELEESSGGQRLSQLMSKRTRLSQRTPSQRTSSQPTPSQPTLSQPTPSQRTPSLRTLSQPTPSQRASTTRTRSQRSCRSDSPQPGPSSR